jgi:hypothetical protein
MKRQLNRKEWKEKYGKARKVAPGLLKYMSEHGANEKLKRMFHKDIISTIMSRHEHDHWPYETHDRIMRWNTLRKRIQSAKQILANERRNYLRHLNKNSEHTHIYMQDKIVRLNKISKGSIK